MCKVGVINNFLSVVEERAVQVGGKDGGLAYMVGYISGTMRRMDISETDLKQLENDTMRLRGIVESTLLEEYERING